jgi:hypothetical protein
VRGLALRSLCSLRLESILEYIQLPLHKSLTDISAYVRKTGVMGILKVSFSRAIRCVWLSLFLTWSVVKPYWVGFRAVILRSTDETKRTLIYL